MKNSLLKLSVLFFAIVLLSSCGVGTIAPESGQYAVESDKFSGTIGVHEGPGVADYFNFFDAVEYYDKENMYSFSHMADEGRRGVDESIYVKFADFGEASISGTVRYAIPTNDSTMQILHERYDSQEGIESELIRQAIERAVYLSGPLMTSQESNSSKRAYLLDIIMDQAQNGVFKVITEDVTSVDVATGKEKTVKVSKPMPCTTEPGCIGGYIRAEPSPLNEYHIRLYNFTIKRIEYSGPVKEQIAKQQEMNMEMDQLSIEAKKAQTQAITTAENAKAKVAEEQSLTDIAVAQAQKETAVAQEELKQKKFQADANYYTKEREAAAVKLNVQAGLSPLQAAQIRKETAIGVAAELAKRPVPQIVTGGGAGGSTIEEAATLKQMMLLMKGLEEN